MLTFMIYPYFWFGFNYSTGDLSRVYTTSCSVSIRTGSIPQGPYSALAVKNDKFYVRLKQIIFKYFKTLAGYYLYIGETDFLNYYILSDPLTMADENGWGISTYPVSLSSLTLRFLFSWPVRKVAWTLMQLM